MAVSESHAAIEIASASEPKPPSVHIAPLAENQSSQWEAFTVENPKSTFFHRLGWKRVMQKTYGYEPRYYGAWRGDKLTGIAPSFLVSSWITGRRLLSIPFAVYGGICAEDPQSEELLLRQLENVAEELGVDYLELRNRDGGIRDGYTANTRYATFTLPVSADIEAIHKALPKDARYMIRKGEKAGLEARSGFDQLDTFYHLMTLNLRRLGTPAFPKTLFQNFIQEFREEVDITVVYSGSNAMAGGMSFFFREWMQPYYIGSREEAKTVAANNFLWWELIKLAARKGCTTFDFGRSKRDSGNFDFKKKWNPKIEFLDYQVRTVKSDKVPDFSPANPQFDLVTSIWKKMPLGLTRMLGPRIVRSFP